jgi:hypothetical protein
VRGKEKGRRRIGGRERERRRGGIYFRPFFRLKRK